MGSRQLGELLFRPSSLRNPAIPQPLSPAWCRTPPCLCRFQRSFSISTAARSPQPQSKSDVELGSSASSSNEDPKRASAETSNAIDSLFRSSGLGQRTSSDEFNAAAPRRPFGSNFSKANSTYRRPGLTFDDMNLPDALPESAPPPPVVAEKDIVYPRLNASTGRTVELDVSRGRDIVRGLNMLGSLMARNRVKRDFQMQRYHERPGLKRKRLKSERWRARFKTEFDATCKRVTELTRKGW